MNDMNADPYAVLSRFYDLEFDGFDADLDMYLQFAENMDGSILELGCGSGRVIKHLESLGNPLTGVDSSVSMLEIARQRVGPHVALQNLDMRALGMPERAPFAFAFCAVNTFLHMPDSESQLMALSSIRSAMQPGGTFVLDVFVAHPDYLLALDGRLEFEFTTTLEDGSRLDKWSSRTHDMASQTIYTTVYYDVTSTNGMLSRNVGEYSTRYIHLFEMEHLLARCGWDIVSIFGGYDLHPFDSESERMIVLATPGRGE